MIGFVKTSLQSIKDLCQLDFFTKSLTFCFVLIYWLCWAESTASTAALQQKRSDILVVLWQKCQIFKVNYLWLKKFDTKINAILLISELMASVRKVLRHFHRHGEMFRLSVIINSSFLPTFFSLYVSETTNTTLTLCNKTKRRSIDKLISMYCTLFAPPSM